VNPNQPVPQMPRSVIAQIAGLSAMPMEKLRALWKELHGTEAPHHIRGFLEKRIACRLQEAEYRKQDPVLLNRNERRIDALVQTGRVAKRDEDFKPLPGTVLSRVYLDEEHRVTVRADGQYEYRGRVLRSLSMVAREITGTQWSGPLFFGLKKAGVKKSRRAGA
jgi:hypothetical protein